MGPWRPNILSSVLGTHEDFYTGFWPCNHFNVWEIANMLRCAGYLLMILSIKRNVFTGCVIFTSNNVWYCECKSLFKSQPRTIYVLGVDPTPSKFFKNYTSKPCSMSCGMSINAALSLLQNWQLHQMWEVGSEVSWEGGDVLGASIYSIKTSKHYRPYQMWEVCPKVLRARTDVLDGHIYPSKSLKVDKSKPCLSLAFYLLKARLLESLLYLPKMHGASRDSSRLPCAVDNIFLMQIFQIHYSKLHVSFFLCPLRLKKHILLLFLL